MHEVVFSDQIYSCLQLCSDGFGQKLKMNTSCLLFLTSDVSIIFLICSKYHKTVVQEKWTLQLQIQDHQPHNRQPPHRVSRNSNTFPQIMYINVR
jgi:hypothetical protein